MRKNENNSRLVSRRTFLAIFIFQLSKPMVQKREKRITCFSLQPAVVTSLCYSRTAEEQPERPCAYIMPLDLPRARCTTPSTILQLFELTSILRHPCCTAVHQSYTNILVVLYECLSYAFDMYVMSVRRLLVHPSGEDYM